MKKLKKKLYPWQFLILIFLVAFGFWGRFLPEKAKSAAENITKMDGGDIVLDTNPKNNEYIITYKTNSSAYSLLMGTKEFEGDAACKYDLNTSSIECRGGGNYGGNNITTDGTYYYIVNDEPDYRIVKMDADFQIVKTVSGSQTGGNDVATDGSYLYVVDMSGGWLCKWNLNLDGDSKKCISFLDSQGVGPSSISYNGKDLIVFTGISVAQWYEVDPYTLNSKLPKYLSDGSYLFTDPFDIVADENYIYGTPFDRSSGQRLCKWDISNGSLRNCTSTLNINISSLAIGHQGSEDLIYVSDVLGRDTFGLARYNFDLVRQDFLSTGFLGSVAMMGNYKIIDTLPANMDFQSGSGSVRYDGDKRTATWYVDSTGEITNSLTLTTRVSNCPLTITNNVILYAGFLKIDGATDSSNVSCSPPHFPNGKSDCFLAGGGTDGTGGIKNYS